MSRLTRYILLQILITTFIAAVLLCLLVTMVQSVKFIDLIVNNGLPVSQFVKMSLYATPRYLVFLIPIVLFGATLFVYNRLISESEIVVMRSAGLSQGRLARAGILAALISVMAGYGLTLYLVPISQYELRTLILQARSQWGSGLLREGKFTTIGDHITLFINERGSDNNLQGIFYNNSREQLTIIAEKGAIIEGENGPRLVIINGSKQTKSNGQLHVLTFEKSTIDFDIQKKIATRWIEPEERFITDLFWPDDATNNQKAIRNLLVEGHNRLVSPLLSLAFPLIALAVILKGRYSRRGNLKHIFLTISIMLAVYILHLWLISALPSNLHLIPAFYANTLLPVLIGLFVILKPKYLKRRARHMPAHPDRKQTP